MDKRGEGDKILGFGFFFLLLMIIVGIAVGVYIVYGSGYDFRQVEAEILNSKILDCIKSNLGYLESINQMAEGDSDRRNELKREFYKKCGLNVQVLENYNLAMVEKNGEIIFSSGGDFEQCKFIASHTSYPKCAYGSINLSGAEYKVTTTSKQNSRRVAG